MRANHPDTDAPDWFYADWDELFDVRPQEEDRFSLDSLIKSLPALLDRLAGVPNFLLWFDIDSLIPPWNVRQDVFEAYVEDADEESPYPDKEEIQEDETDEEEEDGEEIRDAFDDDEMNPDRMISMWKRKRQKKAMAIWWRRPNRRNLQHPGLIRQLVHSISPTRMLASGCTGHWRQWSRASMRNSEWCLSNCGTRGLDRTATWLLTSDFGYPLGEHGQIGCHRPWLYDELVHLPLIIRLPNADEACRRVGQFTQPQDIAPTLLDLFGQVHGSAISEESVFLPLIHGETTTVRESAISKLEFGTASELAIRTKEWAFLLPVKVPPDESREPQLFSKPDDRWEVNDLRARNIERCDEFEEQLKKSVDLHDNFPEV